MIRTIILGNYISAQGIFEREIGNGLIAIRIGDRVYVGKPVGIQGNNNLNN